MIEHPAMEGCAAELLEHILNAERKLPIMTMYVRERRQKLIRLLEKKKFTGEGVVRNFYRSGTDHQDAIVMKNAAPEGDGDYDSW